MLYLRMTETEFSVCIKHVQVVFLSWFTIRCITPGDWFLKPFRAVELYFFFDFSILFSISYLPFFCLLISCKRCWFRYCCWQIQKFYTLKFFLAIFPNNKTAFISIKMILVLALLILKLMCKNWIVLGKKVCENIPIKWVNFIILHKLSKGTHCFLKNLHR